ncbi:MULTISPECIES: VOC family protein [Streptomyces]|uniref:VOC family protein n=1 Tax=Streptomyces TaxID=1883 RepID=UPI00163C15A1|nr:MULTISPECIES: VOC family protein [Streptomyces]MBC2874894.1 VOC family protein [Streptomyces sp. TYQ1024]UBI37336.1 VOC family protein [Streptomyces mobaraensis]UKW29928.1 VOC family protein [Streptomyces sp. TYQ1024]
MTTHDGTTDGIQGFLVETRNYGATAAFWKSLGYEGVLETDHGSGQWQHPAGGPYVFIVEQHERELVTRPVLTVADADAFAPARAPEFARPFTPTHWGVRQALVLDPDGRTVALEAPLSGRHGEHHG